MGKSAIDHFFVKTGQLLSYLYPGCITKVFLSVRDKVYTGYLQRRFAHLGNKTYIRWHAYHVEGTEYISIGDNNIFESGLQLTAWKTSNHEPHITIGNGCMIRRDCHITAVERITIGDHLLTGTNVLITDNTHGNTDFDTLQIPPTQREAVTKGAVVIGDKVWLANNVCVLPGVTIGEGAVIGANSVVTHNIPAHCVAAGIPAKVIKKFGY